MFNIRVYGILKNQHQQLLVSDEYIQNRFITKFCGGGLEFGEGILDCLKREFLEEMNLPIRIVSHFYTTDFFQQSAFNKNEQVVSIYYLIEALAPLPNILISDKIDEEAILNSTNKQIFRWVAWEKFGAHCFTLPIDQLVAKNILQQLQ